MVYCEKTKTSRFALKLSLHTLLLIICVITAGPSVVSSSHKSASCLMLRILVVNDSHRYRALANRVELDTYEVFEKAASLFQHSSFHHPCIRLKLQSQVTLTTNVEEQQLAYISCSKRGACENETSSAPDQVDAQQLLASMASWSRWTSLLQHDAEGGSIADVIYLFTSRKLGGNIRGRSPLPV